jgi:dihydroflavonol-4-reductase
VDVFLTGGSGFVGSHVARLLVQRGARVRCLVRPASRTAELRALGVDLREGDVRDAASIQQAMAGADVVFHCAADYRLDAPNSGDLHHTNVDGTDNVMRAASELGVARVVHTSSVATLSPSDDGTPVDEQARATPDTVVGAYKRTKVLAERVAEDWARRGLHVVIVSPSTPVGEGDAKPTPTGRMIVDFLNGRMPAYVDTGLNLVDVRDVALGHLLAAERGRAGQTYILGNTNLALRDILELVGRTVGRRAPRLRLPVWLPIALAHLEAPVSRLLGRPPRVPLDGARMSRRKMFFDAAKAVRELGVPQSPIGPAVDRAVSWFVSAGFVRDLRTPVEARC